MRTVSIAFCSVCFLLLFSAGCSLNSAGVYLGQPGLEPSVREGGPPPWAPAHGYRAKHAYHYYPDAFVYFDVSRNLYFYLEGAEWTAGVSLPGSIQAQLGDYVCIELETDRPYAYHNEHRSKYPPGQMKKRGKWAKKHGKR